MYIYMYKCMYIYMYIYMYVAAEKKELHHTGVAKTHRMPHLYTLYSAKEPYN